MFVADDPSRYRGRVVGNGHCVPFVQRAAKAPRTALWRRGQLVRGNDIETGTAIATFHPQTGRYENDTTGRSHAAVLLGESARGLLVLDQWVGQPVDQRLIEFRDGRGNKVDDGDQYFVITTA